MKKLLILPITVLFSATVLKAQSIDEGRKYLYYDRLTSAKSTFNTMVNKDSKDEDAIYWLGQTYLRQDSVSAAKTLYERAIQAGNNDAILQVGMGHVELLEGKKDAAKQRFEQAIASTIKRKKENPDILNAIGRANADGPSTTGDPLYAIEKLKKAAELKPNDPEIFINMGVNYLKLGTDHGGDAYSAFNDALKINPNDARAKYRLGKIFLSQGNREKFEGYFAGAIESDPKFSPAYLDLYNYYSERDVNKAKEYLEGYMANTDKDCNVDYFYADYLFRAGKYQESLDKAKAMQNGQCSNLPRLKVLFAYNYDRLGDSIQAKNNIESFLATSAPDKIQPNDYVLASNVLKRIKGSEESAIKYLEIALNNDTLRSNKVMYMDTIASLYRKLGNPDKRIEWLTKSYQTNPQPSNFDIFNIGNAAIDVGRFSLADSMFTLYKTKYPDQIYGYMGLAKSAIMADKDTTAGSAVPAVTEYIKYLEKTDLAKYKNQIIQNYGYLVYIHANNNKDYPAALEALNGILAIDPENAYAKSTSDAIKKIMNRPSKDSKTAGNR